MKHFARSVRLLLTLFVIMMFVSFSSSAFAQSGRSKYKMRTWTSRTGKKVNAVLIRDSGDVVTIKTASGKSARIKKSALSAADQQYLSSLRGSSSSSSSDGGWPCWRGVNRDGKSADTGLLKSWPAGGPRQLWKKSGLGEGFSGVSVSKGVVYATGSVGGTLKIFAFDKGGSEKWSVSAGGAWSKSHPGSRATPTIDGSYLYLLSGKGSLGCYRTSDGGKVWSKEMKEFGGSPGHWGFSESVMILGDNVIVSPGRSTGMAALNKKTGSVVWKSRGNGGPADYCSAIYVKHKNVPMLITGNKDGIFAVSPENGDLLWENDFCRGNTANCPTPAYSDGYVFWSNGYGRGGICLKLSASGSSVSASEAWRTKDLISHHGGYIIHEGHIYGNHNNGWACLDLKTGQKKWFSKGVGKGSVCYADGMLYTFGERKGKMGLVKCSPNGFEQVGEFSVAGSGPSWAHPVVTGGRLYLRYAENLYCFDVKK